MPWLSGAERELYPQTMRVGIVRASWRIWSKVFSLACLKLGIQVDSFKPSIRLSASFVLSSSMISTMRAT